MAEHAIDEATQTRLIELEIASDYQGCSELLSKVISSFMPADNAFLQYEQGAAYLRLAVYYLLCDDEAQYEWFQALAAQILPAPDLLALSAQWIGRSGYAPEKVSELCELFFQSIDERYDLNDSVSQFYLQQMSELKTKSKS